MRWFCYCLPMIILAAVGTSPVQALPLVGWQAELGLGLHNVTGTVSVFDEDTLQVDDFTYDGGGFSVYFYLGTEDSSTAFKVGLSIGDDLVGTMYNGTEGSFLVDLPGGQTIDGWNAVSVWCVTAGVNFGSGTFALPGDFNFDNDADGDDYLRWQRGELLLPHSDSDLADWEASFGTSSPAIASAVVVPEPASAMLLVVAMCGAFLDCRRLARG